MSLLLPKKESFLKCHKNITKLYLFFFTQLIIKQIIKNVSKKHTMILF